MLRKNLLLEVVMKVAVLGVFVENGEAIEKLNEILHGYRDCIMGRMGIPNVNEDWYPDPACTARRLIIVMIIPFLNQSYY